MWNPVYHFIMLHLCPLKNTLPTPKPKTFSHAFLQVHMISYLYLSIWAFEISFCLWYNVGVKIQFFSLNTYTTDWKVYWVLTELCGYFYWKSVNYIYVWILSIDSFAFPYANNTQTPLLKMNSMYLFICSSVLKFYVVLSGHWYWIHKIQSWFYFTLTNQRKKLRPLSFWDVLFPFPLSFFFLFFPFTLLILKIKNVISASCKKCFEIALFFIKL